MILVLAYFFFDLLLLYMAAISLHNLAVCTLGFRLDKLLGEIEFNCRQKLLQRSQISPDFMTWFTAFSLPEAIRHYQELLPIFQADARIFCPVDDEMGKLHD